MASGGAAAGRGEIARSAAAGGTLTHAESLFLERLTDPFSAASSPDREDVTDQELNRRGAAIGLRVEDIRYIREWVVCRGVHWLSCAGADVPPELGARVFRNPVVRRLINAAAQQGLCVATSALKDELEDFFTQRMRSTYLPEAVRDNAADKLAKLKGYYPDAKGSTGGGAAVQIVIADPYRAEVVAHG